MTFTLKNLTLALAAAGTLLLTACGPTAQDDHHIKVGISAGIDQSLWAVVQKVAKQKYDLDVEVVTFNDYVLPNEALNNGDLDVNAFQHKPYLDKQMQERGYKLAAVGNTFVYPIAGYSKKITALSQLPDGAQVAVPNDPTNLGRSLLLLQKQGLITLKEGVGLLPTALDIVGNPKKLKIVEIEAPQLPRAGRSESDAGDHQHQLFQPDRPVAGQGRAVCRRQKLAVRQHLRQPHRQQRQRESERSGQGLSDRRSGGQRRRHLQGRRR